MLRDYKNTTTKLEIKKVALKIRKRRIINSFEFFINQYKVYYQSKRYGRWKYLYKRTHNTVLPKRLTQLHIRQPSSFSATYYTIFTATCLISRFISKSRVIKSTA